MYINLDQVREGPVRWDESLDLDAGSLAVPELLGLSPVRCRGLATFVDPAYHLHADLAYVQKLQCDRCLQPFDQEVEHAFDLVLERATAEGSGAPAAEPRGQRGRRSRADDGAGHDDPAEDAAGMQLEEDDLGVVRVTGDEVSTEPLVTEQVVLNLPMKPLCRPACAGLCPTCGADRNVESCDCKPSGDARLAGLEAWMGKRH